VTEVYPGFQKLLHGDYCHLHSSSCFGFFLFPSANRTYRIRLS
jgi:hypothetical protein